MDKSIKFALVILHYLVLKDTEELLDRIIQSDVSERLNIYVVDNGSNNGTGEALYRRYSKFKNIRVLILSENLGFAKGNNVGIKKALDDGNDFIICSNNDVILDITEDFLNRVVDVYKNDNLIALIGPNIINLNGSKQNPVVWSRPDYDRMMFKLKFIYETKLGKLFYYAKHLMMDKLLYFRNHVCEDKGSGYVYALHGSFLIFTPTFFRYFGGFDEGTFLYCEEIILAEMIYRKNLKAFYDEDIFVTHKEDVSTDFYLKRSNLSKLKFSLRYNYESYKYFLEKYLK